MILTLVGYRGCGKSTIAPALAARLGYRWLDSDRMIEERAGRTIRDIFETDGESGFRDLEQQVLSDICLAEDRLVLAAGGGVVLRDVNRRLLRRSGRVIWLTAPPAALAQRIQDDARSKESRPNLTGESDLLNEVTTILDRRRHLYDSVSDFCVSTHDRPIKTIVADIVTGLAALSGGAFQDTSPDAPGDPSA